MQLQYSSFGFTVVTLSANAHLAMLITLMLINMSSSHCMVLPALLEKLDQKEYILVVWYGSICRLCGRVVYLSCEFPFPSSITHFRCDRDAIAHVQGTGLLS